VVRGWRLPKDEEDMSEIYPARDREWPTTPPSGVARIRPIDAGAGASIASALEFRISWKKIAYGVYYGGGGKYLYQPITKCACTTIKTLLLGLEGLPVDENEWRRHNKKFNNFPGLSDVTRSELRDVLQGRTDTFKFAIVRNPYSRLASVYRDKILHSGQHWKRQIWDSADLFGAALSDPITFEEFVDIVSRQHVADMDPHWRPQFYEGRFGYINYDFVGKMEMMPSPLVYALEQIDAPKAVIAQAAKRHNQSDAISPLWPTVSEQTRTLYLKTFAVDFDALQYPRRLPAEA